MDIFQVFLNVVLPVFLIAGAGVLLHRFRPIPVAPLSQTILYLFSPALVFHGLTTTQIPPAELGVIALFSLLLLISLYLVGGVSALALRITDPARRTFIIAVIFITRETTAYP